MRTSTSGLLVAVALSVTVAGTAPAQAVALPLNGEGELAMQDTVQDVARGSVLLQADNTVKIVFIDTGAPRTLLAGAWRMTDSSTAELAVHSVRDGTLARGSGEIRFRPDGSVDHLAARGRTDGGEFTFQYDNAVSVAVAGDPVPPRKQAPQTGRDPFPWGGEWALLDATRRGEGRLTDAAGQEQQFDRARLTLGENDEFLLVLDGDGDTPVEFAGTWEGDPRASPVRLQLREAMGEKVGGVGRAWLRERSYDRDWSFRRVELDGWNDEGGDAFTLYFEAGDPPGEP